MQRQRWTPEQKADALRLLAEHGKAEAARRTGIPAGTIASWGVRCHVAAPTPEALRPVVEARQIAWAHRKLDFGERLATLAGKAADALEERLDNRVATGIRDHAATIALLVDKAQLLTGGATSRDEVVQRTPEAEQELAQVLELVRTA